MTSKEKAIKNSFPLTTILFSFCKMESIFDQQQLTGFVGMYNIIKSSIKNK
jgi:hypothetical protein